MLEQLVVIAVGLIGGISVGVQTPIANAMSQRVGSASSSLIVHLSGAILSGLLVLARGGEAIRDISRLSWYMLGSGVFGLILYLTINQTIPRLGATAASTLIIVGQLVAGMVIDHFGFFDVTQRPIDAGRLVAVALLLAGAYLMAR